MPRRASAPVPSLEAWGASLAWGLLAQRGMEAAALRSGEPPAVRCLRHILQNQTTNLEHHVPVRRPIPKEDE